MLPMRTVVRYVYGQFKIFKLYSIFFKKLYKEYILHYELHTSNLKLLYFTKEILHAQQLLLQKELSIVGPKCHFSCWSQIHMDPIVSGGTGSTALNIPQ